MLDGLKRGTYKVTELETQRYEVASVNADGSNCKNNVVSAKGQESVTFEIGTPKETDMSGKKGVANFRNKKTTDSGKRTDTDVRVNRFTKENGKWTWKGYDLSTSKPTSKQQ